MLIAPYAHLFVAGIVLSKISTTREISAQRGVVLGGCLLTAVLRSAAHADRLSSGTRQYSPIAAAVITALLFGLMCWVAVRGIPSLRRPAFAALGAASYPLYLLHQEIGYHLYDAWRGPFWLMFPVLVVGFCAASHLISTGIETPVNRWFKARTSVN